MESDHSALEEYTMIILSVPINKLQSSLSQIEKAREHGYKIEYRLDYSKNIQKDLCLLPVIDENTIITIRDMKEGGIYYYPLSDKLELYKRMVEKYNSLVDLEYSNYYNGVESIGDNIILSRHEQRNYSLNDYQRYYKMLEQKKCKFIKIVALLDKYNDILLAQEFLRDINERVLFCGIGALGKLSRYLYRLIGSVGTYIGVEDSLTNASQPALSDFMSTAISVEDRDVLVGGIIGGSQVVHSKGLGYYNSLFMRETINAMYLPFVVEDINDFKKWFTLNNKKMFGISITMPYKSQWAETRIGNYYIPQIDELGNSDVIAMQKAIEKLKIEGNARVLLLGSGDMAELFLQKYNQDFRLTMYARNEERISKLQGKYSFTRRVEDKYDLLVNCTCLGLQGESVLDWLSIPAIKTVIDLPYTEQDTPLIEYCKKRDIPYVSGEQFWEWQAEKQQEQFIAAIEKIENPT